jgi:deoxyadenosine/deoxycytidine kinase
VIYLQADIQTLIERVAQRANPREAGITPAYLEALAASYTHFFQHYDGAPLLAVNTEHLNPIDRDGDLALLLARLGGMRGRRDCFNLAA